MCMCVYVNVVCLLSPCSADKWTRHSTMSGTMAPESDVLVCVCACMRVCVCLSCVFACAVCMRVYVSVFVASRAYIGGASAPQGPQGLTEQGAADISRRGQTVKAQAVCVCVRVCVSSRLCVCVCVCVCLNPTLTSSSITVASLSGITTLSQIISGTSRSLKLSSRLKIHLTLMCVITHEI